MRINILAVDDFGRFGGAEVALLRTFNHINRDQFNTHLILPFDGPLADKFRNAGVTVSFINLSELKKHWRNPRRIIKVLKKLKRYADRNDTHIILPQSWWTTLLCAAAFRFSKTSVVASMHAFPIIRTPSKRILFRLFKSFFLNRVDQFIAVSKALENSLIESGIPESVISVIPNGLDLVEFSPGNDRGRRRRYGLTERHTAIGVIGRIHPGKGLEMFVRAAKLTVEKYPDTRFFIIGEEIKVPLENLNFTEKLQKYIDELHLSDKIKLIGFQEQLNNLINALDIIVSPSPEETFGLTLLEAMACSKPVIACRTGGVPELVDHETNGLLVPPGSVQSLAEAMNKLISVPELRKNFGKHARIKAENHYNIKKTVFMLEKLLKSCYKKNCLE